MDQILANWAQSVPWLAGIFVVVAAVWVVVREYRKLRDEIGTEVERQVTSHIGAVIGDVQITAGRVSQSAQLVNSLREVMETQAKDFQESLRSREAVIETQFRSVEAAIGQIAKSVPSERELDWVSPRDLVSRAETAGSWSEAAPLLQLVMDDTNATSQDLRVAGRVAETWRFFSKARAFYERSLRVDPESPRTRVYLLCLDAETSSDGRDAAIEEAGELCVANSNDKNILARYSNMCVELDLYSNLISTFEPLAKMPLMRESAVQIERDLGTAYMSTDRPDEAEEHFKKALDLDPTQENTLPPYLGLLEQRGKWSEALDVAKRLLDIDPLDSRYYGFAGEVYSHIQQPDAAMAFYQRAEALARSDSDRIRYHREVQRIEARANLDHGIPGIIAPANIPTA